jgi:hypothetical protein
MTSPGTLTPEEFSRIPIAWKDVDYDPALLTGQEANTIPLDGFVVLNNHHHFEHAFIDDVWLCDNDMPEPDQDLYFGDNLSVEFHIYIGDILPQIALSKANEDEGSIDLWMDARYPGVEYTAMSTDRYAVQRRGSVKSADLPDTVLGLLALGEGGALFALHADLSGGNGDGRKAAVIADLTSFLSTEASLERRDRRQR